MELIAECTMRILHAVFILSHTTETPERDRSVFIPLHHSILSHREIFHLFVLHLFVLFFFFFLSFSHIPKSWQFNVIVVKIANATKNLMKVLSCRQQQILCVYLRLSSVLYTFFCSVIVRVTAIVSRACVLARIRKSYCFSISRREAIVCIWTFLFSCMFLLSFFFALPFA